MPYLPSNVYGLVTVKFAGGAVPRGAVCTFGVTKASPLGQGDVDALAPLVGAMHEDLAAAGCNLAGISLKVGPGDDGPTYENAISTVGSSGSSPAPPNVALLIKKRSVIGGRHGRGRMFWPGTDEGAFDGGGNLLSGDLSAKQNVLNTFYDACINIDLEPVLLHATAVPAPSLITNLLVDGRAATQRRRLR